MSFSSPCLSTAPVRGQLRRTKQFTKPNGQAVWNLLPLAFRFTFKRGSSVNQRTTHDDGISTRKIELAIIFGR